MLGGRRGILGGSVLVAVGVAFLLPPLGVPNAGSYLFVALGLAFGAAWIVGTRQYVYLVPAAVLLGFGLGLVIPSWFSLSSELAAPTFLGALAIGLAVVFLLQPQRWVPLVIAAVLAIVALADLIANVELVPGALQPYFVPLLLVATGVYLLIEQRPA